MEALGNPGEALGCYRMALSAGPDHSEARRNLGSLIVQMDLVQAL